MPLISVVMPVYNAGSFLREAIDSILNQTVSDFELILINDGSTDNSEATILTYSDPRIVYIRNEKNLGLIASLNRGLETARGKYIARMDNDDISDLTRFEKQLALIGRHPDVSVVCSPIIGITPGGKLRDHWPSDINNRSSKQIAATLPKENCISHPTIFARAEVMKKYRYAAEQKGSEDWDLWLRLVRDGHRILKTPEVLLQYRIHQGSITGLYNRKLSPQLKSIGVKYRFFTGSIRAGRFNWFVLKTLLYSAKDFFYYFRKEFLPDFLRQIKWVFSISPIKASHQYRHLKRSLKEGQSRLFFFFPYSHLGGAEKVHAQITKLFANEKPFVFFTGLHNLADHSAQFGSQCILLHCGAALYHPFYSARSSRLIFDKIQSARKPVVFGANNLFFDDLILRISSAIFVVDLTHDIFYTAQVSQRDLDIALRPQARVFISNQAIKRTLDFYDAHFVDENEKTKIKLIYNYVEMPAKSRNKNWQPVFKVLYVGRDTSEKRVDRIFSLAEAAEKQKLPFVFEFAGEIKHRHLPSNCKLHGKILDPDKLNDLYDSAHFVIISSESEGFPLSLMEGMAHGCIPLATAVGDIPFHIRNGQTGFVTISEENKVLNGFLEILKTIGEDKNLEAMSQNCRTYTAEVFNKARFEESYRQLLLSDPDQVKDL